MMGPSAPNGPPVPMLIAAERGLTMATFGSMRLPRVRMASIASGHAVAANFVRTEPRHHADYQTAGDWGAQYQPPGMVLRSRRHQIGAPSLVENKVGDQPDQPD